MMKSSALLALSLFAMSAAAETRQEVVAEALTAASRLSGSHSITTGAEVQIPLVGDSRFLQVDPVIASDGESFLLLWREYRVPGRDEVVPPASLYAARLNRRGEPVSENPTLISATARSKPGVAFDGTNYLVIWNEPVLVGSRLVGQRFSVDAVPVDPVPFHIGAGGDISVACGPENCLVVLNWGAALIPKSGESLQFSYAAFRSSRSVVIPVPDGYAGVITLAERYAIGGIIGATADFEAHAFVKFPHAEPEPDQPFLFTSHLSRSWEETSASLASNGSTLVVAALDIQTTARDGTSRELFVARVPSDPRELRFGSNRTTITPEMIDGFPAMIRDPQIVWNGRKFLLVFHISDQVLYPGRDARLATKGEIVGLWVEPDGGVVSDDLFQLTSAEGVEWEPSLAVGSRGQMALAFLRSPGGENLLTTRLFVKILSDGASRLRPVRRP